MAQRDDLVVWMDLEMTGLDPETCRIVQLAMIITDRQLVEVAGPLELTIWQPPAALETMVPFVRNMHTKSGLRDLIGRSEVDIDDAQRQVMAILADHCKFQACSLAGNSIWQDRRFLARHMPLVDGYLHYRLLDVSSIKQVARWWHNIRYEKPKDARHTALFDIRQSIAELKYYRDNLFAT